MISPYARRRDEEPDCWTRVLSRSAGCKRKAERTPVLRPAAKWKAVYGHLISAMAF